MNSLDINAPRYLQEQLVLEGAGGGQNGTGKW